MIYAFKRGNVAQSLEEHVNECLKAFDDLKNTRLWSIELNEIFMRRVIVFHDIGKVLYQREGDLSFAGHEFASAYVFWKVFENELGDRELLYLFPIIFHHHAMDIKKRLEKFENIRFTSIRSNILKELQELIERYENGEVVEKTIEALSKMKVSQAAYKVRSKIEQIWRIFDGKFARKALRLLFITVICDYMGAKDRGAPTGFGRVLKEFYELYTRKSFEA